MIRLDAPKSQLWLLRGDWHEQWATLKRRVVEHPYNHAVEVVVPGAVKLPPVLSPPTPHYYTSPHLPLAHFTQPDIIQRYHSLTALSLGSKVDTNNVYAVLPSGKLMMSVDKDTYEQLGLQGRASRFQKGHRFLVEVDLTASCFRPGRPNYERVKWSLTEPLRLQADFTITWTPTGLPGATESQFLLDFTAEKHECVMDRELLHNVPLPVARAEHPNGHSEGGSALCCTAAELHLWLGAVACGVDLTEGSPGDYVSTFTPPEPHSMCQYGTRTRWTGMLSSEFICSLLEKAKQYLADCGSEGPPWLAVSVWGFEDSPVSWRTCEHGYFLSGDNHYSAVLFATGHFWHISALATHDLVQ